LKRIVLFGIVLIGSCQVLAQKWFPLASRSVAMQSCDVAYPGLWSCATNPAGIAFMNELSCGMMYENRYGLPELSTRSVAISLATGLGNAGVLVSRFGSMEMHHTRVGLCVARGFGHMVSAGFQMNYYSQFVQPSGHYGCLVSNAGWMVTPVDGFTLGMQVFNPEQAALSYPGFVKKVPSYFSVGFAWRINSFCYLYGECDKFFDLSPFFSTALEVSVNSHFQWRGGYSLNEKKLGCGLSLKLNRLCFDLGAAFYHPLGMVSTVSLSYQIVKKKANKS